MTIIPGHQEAEAGGYQVQAQPGQFRENLFQNLKIFKKGWVSSLLWRSWVQSLAPQIKQNKTNTHAHTHLSTQLRSCSAGLNSNSWSPPSCPEHFPSWHWVAVLPCGSWLKEATTFSPLGLMSINRPTNQFHSTFKFIPAYSSNKKTLEQRIMKRWARNILK